MLLTVVLVLVTCLLLLYKAWQRKYEEAARKLPGPESWTPLGIATRFLKLRDPSASDIYDLFCELSEDYKEHGIMKLWIGPFLGVMIWEPKYIEEVAINPATARKGNLFHFILSDIIDGIFVNVGDEDWKELRKAFNRTMSRKAIDTSYHQVFAERTYRLVDQLRASTEKSVNVIQELYLLNFDTFSETHLGLDLDTLRTKEVRFLDGCVRYLDHRIRSLVRLWPFALTFFTTQLPELKKEGFDFLKEKVIAERKKTLTEMPNPDEVECYGDFLLRRAAQRGESVESLCRQLSEILAAGSETTGMAVSALLVFLATHPQIQEEAYREQEEIFGQDRERAPSPEDLSRMNLLQRVAKETARHIATLFVHKEAEEDIKIGEYDIPKGTYIIVNNRRTLHNPDYWERPEEFFPDHFLPDAVSRRPAHAYVAFGVGPRQCAGIKYALHFMSVVSSILIRNLKFSSKYKYEELKYEMALMCTFQSKFYQLEYEERL